MIKNKAKMVKTKKLKSDNGDMWWGASMVTVLYLALLLTTAPRTNVSYADSDELLTVANNLGVAHPSGYPIYIILLWLFLKLPIGEIAFRGHFLAMIGHSLALGLVFASSWKLAEYSGQKNKKLSLINEKTDRWVVAIISSLVLASNYIFWLYGQITEKYSFSNLLIAIFIFLIVTIFRDNKNKRRDWLWLGIVSGLMVGHHQTLVLLLPMGIILFLLKKGKNNEEEKKKALSALLGLVGAITVMVIALIALNSNSQAEVSWNFKSSFEGLTGHIFRQEFGFGNQDNFEFGSAYIDTNKLGSNIIGGMPVFLRYSASYWGIVNLIAGLVGAIFVWKKNRKLGYVLGSGLVISILFSAYVTIDDFNMMPSIVRQYLMAYMLMAILVTLGWYFIIVRLNKGLRVISKNSNGSKALAGLIIIILALRIVRLYPQADMSSYDFISRFHRKVLNDLPRDSMLICFTDTSCFALLYEQNVNQLRKDVIVLPTAYPLVETKLSKIDNLKGYDYQDNTYRIFDYITWNIDKRRIFTLDFDQRYYDMLGMAYGFIYYVPTGYVAELVKEMPEEYNEPDYSFSLEIKENPAPELDIMRKWINTMTPRIHFKNAAMYIKMGNRNEARNQLNMASDILHQIPEIDLSQVEGQRKAIEDSGVVDIFRLDAEAFTAEQIWESVNQYYENRIYNQAFIGALGILSGEPTNKEARMLMADIYENQGNWQMALVEYQNLAKYHKDQIFIEKIREMKDRLNYGF